MPSSILKSSVRCPVQQFRVIIRVCDHVLTAGFANVFVLQLLKLVQLIQNPTFPAGELPGNGEPELSVFAAIFSTFPADLSQRCQMSDFMSDVGF